MERTIGLFGATTVGVGAIVGGGILALAGAAFQVTGPGAMLAFALNGVIAVLTALSFAEMSTCFPESGGAYTFAKKILNVRAAFGVGWVLWFAYIVAAVLYALGFAEFASQAVADLWVLLSAGKPAPPWLHSGATTHGFALAAVALYTVSLIRRAAGGGDWATHGKVLVFAVLIVAGLWALGFARDPGHHLGQLSPFLPRGLTGLFQAMGFTFIALQGFDLIAAVAGEITSPRKVIPRAMLFSLAIALVVYLPLLLVVSTVGVTPGSSLMEMSARNPETVMAAAVRNYLGDAGYWFVVVAALLSMLSALQANLMAASRVALSMARDRTLPSVLAQIHEARGTPMWAIYATALATVIILYLLPDIASAGAAASLIFLIAFCLAHITSYLARIRMGGSDVSSSGHRSHHAMPLLPDMYRTPAFPAVPVVGGVACALLALFQAIAVPAAGGIVAVWLGLGVILYYALFASSAEAMDAYAEAADPDLARLRGRNPLVLVPISNPVTASALVTLGNAMAPPRVGRVLLLNVMQRPRRSTTGQRPEDIAFHVNRSQDVLQRSLTTALVEGHSPETLLTISSRPWKEIVRVADIHSCESVLLGFTSPAEEDKSIVKQSEELEALVGQLSCNVAVLRAEAHWQPNGIPSVLVTMSQDGLRDDLRARILGSLGRLQVKNIAFLRVLPCNASDLRVRDARLKLERLASDESPVQAQCLVVRSDNVQEAIAQHAVPDGLVIVGLRRQRRQALLGERSLQIAKAAPGATLMLSRRPRITFS